MFPCKSVKRDKLTFGTSKSGFGANHLFRRPESCYNSAIKPARKEGMPMEAVLNAILTNLPLVLCLLIGVGLLVVEVFVPGFGLPGISGIVLTVVGVVLTWNAYGPVAGLAVTLISLALAGIAISVSIKSAATGKLSKSALILNEVTAPVEHEEADALTGKEGVTATVLNPVGFAEFDGVRLNVVSEGSYLEKGAKVKVQQVEGNKIIVREV